MALGSSDEKESVDGEGRMKLMDVNFGKLFGLKYGLVCRLKLAVDMVGMLSGSLCMMQMDNHS